MPYLNSVHLFHDFMIKEQYPVFKGWYLCAGLYIFTHQKNYYT